MVDTTNDKLLVAIRIANGIVENIRRTDMFNAYTDADLALMFDAISDGFMTRSIDELISLERNNYNVSGGVK